MIFTFYGFKNLDYSLFLAPRSFETRKLVQKTSGGVGKELRGSFPATESYPQITPVLLSLDLLFATPLLSESFALIANSGISSISCQS